MKKLTKKPNVLVLSGDGLNSEIETKRAFELAGSHADIIHINDLLNNKSLLKKYQAMALPGGFSFGDELGSGQILSLKIKYQLADEWKQFLLNKKPIIGICNGFQVLSKLGAFTPDSELSPISLGPNKSNKFINKWINLKVNKQTSCIWTSLLRDKQDDLELSIRHAEGAVCFTKGEESTIYKNLIKERQIVLEYTEDVNGSIHKIAGLCDPSGLVFGLMPHPETFVSNMVHPTKSSTELRNEKGDGLLIFESAISYLWNN